MKVTDRRTLPRSNLSLTVMGLGCAQMGGLYRWTSLAEAEAVADAAWNAGLRYYDTAPFYGFTRAERRLGTLLGERERSHYAVSTKAGRLMVPDATVGAEEDGYVRPLPFRPVYDYSYDGILKSFEHSQQRLGLIHIDILYVHDIGRFTHGDRHEHYWTQLTRGGGFRALGELRAGGQVAAVGLGVNEHEVVQDALQAFDIDVTMLAGRYTLLEQRSLPLLDACVRAGASIVIAGPFNSGILVGNNKFNYADAPAEVVARVRALRAVCDEFAVPLPAAALQFPMAHPAVVTCVSGSRTAGQLQSNIDWFEQPIPPEFWDVLKERGLVEETAPLPSPAA
ncbi:aldo/keto reductase [Azospirillum thermophilum]|uniref:Pyridoxal 4-dehydrogenase n=1 Tax=Azospirillum thermophilum TaxID=2202148 RepID=A0A2S2CLC8_9PROT|nr:aldo/keto reductase [Azospirillum thermophilum]AWK85281.1 pyridoxal 4-dehydrogenase [Azospirillum thermophilum]